MSSGFLFDPTEIPVAAANRDKNFRSLQFPVWSEQKALLIQEYIRLFTYITKHGTYIDGFAAPQRRNELDICSAKLVLETQPRRVKDFWLCDLDERALNLLEPVVIEHRAAGRRIQLLAGDFNVLVDEILSSGRIKSKTATFALLDQRTFECAWDTVERLASYKASLDPNAMKIEIFYFLASGWLDRSIRAVRRPETASKLDRWWGKSDWRALQGMEGISRAKLFAQRFRDELGYQHAHAYAIHNRRRGGRTMYHMIHATDHAEASPLMLRAHRKVAGHSDIENIQADMDELWNEALQDAIGD